MHTRSDFFQPSAAAVIATGVARIGVRVLSEVFQHKKLLLAFSKFAFQVGSVLRLDQLPGGSTFGGNRLLDFAGLHRAVVIELAELLNNSVGAGHDVGLRFAAAVRKLRLQVALTELGLITHGVDGVDHIAELIAQIDILFAKGVADAVHILGDEVQTGFIACRCSCVIDRKVGTQSTKAAVATRIATATVAIATTKTAEAAAAAPAEEQQDDQPAPHIAGVAPAATIAAVHCRHDFPRVIAARAADGVDRYCFHFVTSFC